MDAIQDWAVHLMDNPEILATYTPYLRHLTSTTSLLKSYLYPLIDKVTRNPDLATVALLLIILFVSLKILDMLWQTLVFWFRLARKVVVWGGLAVLAVWMYSRGPDGVWEDVEYWVGVWGQERDYWRERERTARMAKVGTGGGARGGRAAAGTGGGWF